MLKQHLSPLPCPTPLSYALHRSFISDSSNLAPSGAGVHSQYVAFSLLLCSSLCSSHFCAPVWTLHSLQGRYQFFHEAPPSLMSVFSLLFLSLFFPPPLSVWHFTNFFFCVFMEVSLAGTMCSLFMGPLEPIVPDCVWHWATPASSHRGLWKT